MDLGIHVIDPNQKFLVSWRGQDAGPTRLPDILALAQKFAKLLLTTPGSDIYCLPTIGEDSGCTLKQYLAREIDEDTSMAMVRSRISNFVSSVERFVLKEQSRFPSMARSARLRSAVLNKVYYSTEGKLSIDVSLESESGEKFRTAIDQDQVLNFREGDR